MNIFLEALKHCYNRDEMDTDAIRDTLKHLGMKSIVIREEHAFSYESGLAPFTYSEWDCSKYGLYTVIKTLYRPKDNDYIGHFGAENMNDRDKKIVLECLSYCLQRKTMEPDDISTRLKQKWGQNIVMKDCMSGSSNYIKGKSHEISNWIVAAFGLYTIVLIKEIR